MDRMDDLNALALEHLDKALAAPHGRSAHLLVHQNVLRQTLIALREGTALDEHEAPQAASIQVLHGRVRLTAASGDQVVETDGLVPIPSERHGLLALSDAAVLLTTVTGV
jgi:quercetin dioxygenase-like cupin family protein